jgi:hypothetical protein
MSVGTETVPFRFSPSVDSETSKAIAGTRSWTGVDRNAKSCGTVAVAGTVAGTVVVVVVVLPVDVEGGRCVLGSDVVVGVGAGPASGWS